MAVRALLRNPLFILLIATGIGFLAMGIRNSFGVFLKPMTLDLGWSREVFAFGLAVQNLVWGVSQPFLGALADRYGPARIVALGSVLYVVGLLVMSVSSSPGLYSVSAGLLLGLALAGTGSPILLSVVGARAPASRRSLYLGIAGAGGSSGQVLVVPAGALFIGELGWAGALLAFAVLAFLMVPLSAGLAGRVVSAAEGSAQSLRHAVREAAGHSGFWLLSLGFFVCGFHVTFIGIHLPAFISDAGLSPGIGALALSLIGLGNIMGGLLCGYLGGRFRKKYVLSWLYLTRSVLITGFVSFPVTEASVLIFAFSFGIVWLGTVPVTGGLVADIFGVRYMATLFGFVFLGHQLGSFLGAWFGGRVFDETGSYLIVWWIAIGLGVLAAAVHWPIRDQQILRPAATRVG